MFVSTEIARRYSTGGSISEVGIFCIKVSTGNWCRWAFHFRNCQQNGLYLEEEQIHRQINRDEREDKNILREFRTHKLAFHHHQPGGRGLHHVLWFSSFRSTGLQGSVKSNIMRLCSAQENDESKTIRWLLLLHWTWLINVKRLKLKLWKCECVSVTIHPDRNRYLIS